MGKRRGSSVFKFAIILHAALLIVLFQNCAGFEAPAGLENATSEVDTSIDQPSDPGMNPTPTSTPGPNPTPSPRPSATPGPSPTPSPSATPSVPDEPLLVFMASGHVGRTIMSCDGGQSWIRNRSDNDNTRCWVTSSPNNVECDHTISSGRGIDSGDGYFFANFGWGSAGSVRRTRDGINWTTIRTGGWGGGIAYAMNALFSLWGYNSAFSLNLGQNWMLLQNSALIDNLDHPLTFRTGQLVFAVGRTPGIAMSRDGGRSWLSLPTINNQWAQYFASGNGLVIMAGASSVTISADNGSTWTNVPNAVSGQFTGLEFDGTYFVGWSDSGRRWRSTNGQTWSQTALAISGGYNVANFRGPISYNAETGTYVAIPNNWDQYYALQKAFISTDGAQWTQLSASAFPGGHPINNITVGPMDPEYCP